jgi:Tol biopolymer transport system component
VSHQALTPHWSPDGKQIAFAAPKPGKRLGIYVVAAEGGAPQELISDQQDHIDPVWSPDGNSLAFGANPWSQLSIIDIKVLDLSSRKLRTLPGSEELCTPRWSPDQRYLAAVSRDAHKLMVFDFKTQKWTVLANTVVNSPAWSRDGNYIYFDNYPAQKEPAIMRLRRRDRKLERMVSLKDVRRIAAWTGLPWSGIDPEGVPLVVRDIGSQEIYALDVQFP